MPDFTFAFADAPEAIGPHEVVFSPPLPAALQGAFLRNGPGIQQVGGRKQHYFDGYAFIAALQVSGGKATLVGRHVETGVWKRERAAGRQLTRKPFTNLPGVLSNTFRLNLGNPANHDVYRWGGHVVASDAPGHYLLDPTTLATVGPAPQNKWGKAPGGGAPMPRPDPATGKLVTYFTRPGAGSTAVQVKELNPDWSVAREVSATVRGAGSFLHDLAFTPRWVVIAEFGRLNPLKVLLGRATVWDSLNPGKTPLRYLIIDREKGGPAREVVVPNGQQPFHLTNAYEEDGALLFDGVLYQGYLDFRSLYPPGVERPGPTVNLPAPKLFRVRFDTATGASTLTPHDAPPVEAPCVNPAFFGKRHRYVWGPTPGSAGDEEAHGGYFWFHGVARLDLETGKHQVFDFGPRTFTSPPAFVQQPGTTGEDEGWLFCWTTDAAAQKSGVAVFDAADVARGPISRATLDVLLPAVSHCEFASA